MYKTLNFLFCKIDKIECNTRLLRRNEVMHVICVTSTVLDPVKYNNLQILCLFKDFFFTLKIFVLGNSLVVHWLGLYTLIAEGMGLIPGLRSVMLCGVAKISMLKNVPDKVTPVPKLILNQ